MGSEMDDVLRAPCRWCGYNGEGYWQRFTHKKDCPWYGVGGLLERRDTLPRIEPPAAARASGEGAGEPSMIAPVNAREQHLFDVYAALGVQWGDDPFPVIASLRAAAPPAGGEADAREREPRPELDEDEATCCHAGKDGDCAWTWCPQRRDYRSHCPLDFIPLDALREEEQ